MAKVSRTYRLSGEVMEIIEGRDRNKYPSANSFVEERILRARAERRETELAATLEDMKEEMARMRMEMAEMRRAISEERNVIPLIPEFQD